MPYAQRDTHSDIRTSHTGRYTHRGTHGATRAHAAQGDIPHVDEMLHHLTPQPDRILHGSLPSFTPDLVSGSRLGVFGPNPRRSTECCTTLLLFMMSSVPHQNENGGQGGRKTRAIYKGRRKEMPQTGGAIFCRCAVWGSVVLTFPYYAQRLGGIWGLTAAVCILGNLEYMKSDMQAIGQWLVCTSLLCKQSLSLPQTRPPTRQPTRHPTMQCRKAELQGIHFVRALCVGAPGA